MSREYLIEILRRQRQQQNRKKTMVLPSRRYEPLGRRRLKVTLNFWDLGRLIDGSDWMDSYSPTLMFPSGWHQIKIEYQGDFDTSTFSTADVNNAIFAIEPNPANWADVFHKIGYEEAEKYGIEIVPDTDIDFESDPSTWYAAARDGSRRHLFTPIGSDPVANTTWTAKGLQVPRMAKLGLITSAAFYRLNTSITTRHKITLSADPSAPTVPFILNANCDIYLTPCLHFWWAATSATTSIGPPNICTADTLDGIIYPYNRSYFLDNATLAAANDTFALCSDIGWLGTTVGENLETYLKTIIPGAKLLSTITNVTSGSLVSENFADVTSFPTSGGTSITLGNGDANNPYNDLLMAVIKKGSTYYYVWGLGTGYGFGQTVRINYTNA